MKRHETPTETTERTETPRGEESREEIRETPPTPSRGSRFADFWNLWPNHKRKVARRQCGQKWALRGCDGFADEVLSALRLAIASDDWQRDGGKFIPAPLVWLNQDRWEAPPVSSTGPPVTVASTAADKTAEYIAKQSAHVATAPPPNLADVRQRLAARKLA